MHQADDSLPLAEVEFIETPAPGAWGERLSILPIAITLAVQALVSMTAVAVPVFMPVVAGELQYPASYVGIFVTIIYLGATLAAPVSGYFIDRFGAISVSQICLFLCALGLALFTCASIPWMVSGALIIGFGYGPVTPASTHLLVRTTPVSLIAMVFSIKQTGVPMEEPWPVF
jgi:MFS family permease